MKTDRSQPWPYPRQWEWWIGGWAVAATLALSACSSTEADTLEGPGLDDPYETSAGTGGLTGADSASGGEPSPEGTTSDGDVPDPGAGSSGGEGPFDEDVPMSPCPEPLPQTWIFCEDFESIEDPAAVFFEYQSDGGAFVLVDDQGASGNHSMRASYHATFEGAGWLSIAFGENPVVSAERPLYAGTKQFDEVYWRMRIRMQRGWPDVGPRKLTRLTSVADANWAQSMMASLYTNGDEVALAGDPASCVVDGSVSCTGFGDASLQPLGLLPGKRPLFSDDYSGQWHCVEGHVRLNTPGEMDGVFEFWVDDELENGRYDLDWRGSWQQYGINLIAVENFWTGGAPEDLDRWIDDIAISTEPIGCE